MSATSSSAWLINASRARRTASAIASFEIDPCHRSVMASQAIPRNVIQNVTDKNARTAKSGPAVTHRRIGDDKPPQGFAHRGSPLSLRALSQ